MKSSMMGPIPSALGPIRIMAHKAENNFESLALDKVKGALDISHP